MSAPAHLWERNPDRANQQGIALEGGGAIPLDGGGGFALLMSCSGEHVIFGVWA